MQPNTILKNAKNAVMTQQWDEAAQNLTAYFEARQRANPKKLSKNDNIALEMGGDVTEVLQKRNPEDPVLMTALGAAAGAFLGAVPGALVGSAGMAWIGGIVGGAVGGHTTAPADRKGRGAWGGGIGASVFGPVGAAAGGALAGRKPGKRNNPDEHEAKKLKNRLLK